MNRIKEIRVSRKYTQDALAKELGISREYLNKVENGTKPLSGKLLSLIASKLDSTPEEICPDEFGRGTDSLMMANFIKENEIYLSDLKIFKLYMNEVQQHAEGSKGTHRLTFIEAAQILDLLSARPQVERKLHKIQKNLLKLSEMNYDSSPHSPLGGIRMEDEAGNKFIYRAPKNKISSPSNHYDRLEELEHEFTQLICLLALLGEYEKRIIDGSDVESHYMLDYLHNVPPDTLKKKYPMVVSQQEAARHRAVLIIKKKLIVARQFKLDLPVSYARSLLGD
jgi:transcriptional regulator with XRE-family HTH domain